MFSKTNKKEKLDTEQREQYEYARKRIQQKKGLMRHFIVFLVGLSRLNLQVVLRASGYIWAMQRDFLHPFGMKNTIDPHGI